MTYYFCTIVILMYYICVLCPYNHISILIFLVCSGLLYNCFHVLCVEITCIILWCVLLIFMCGRVVTLSLEIEFFVCYTVLLLCIITVC